ncbi:hypothetical protein C8R45DRAFT_946806 [Mycena sanguinolenta]|nr:hypothetical protein C8R45DRAFT_946806 [Mycena sanguinolenta]
MSNPLFEPLRVAVACKNCRDKKIKCMSNHQQLPCMRCETNGLVCEYVSTEKQKARGAGGKNRGQDDTRYPPSTPPPPGSSTRQKNPNLYGDGQTPFYTGYDQNGSGFRPGTPSMPPAFGGHPYTNNHHGGPSYMPSNQQNNAVPNYGGPQYVAGTPYPSTSGNMQPGTYSGSVPPQQLANSGYPTNYANYSYDWTSNQRRQADVALDSHSVPEKENSMKITRTKSMPWWSAKVNIYVKLQILTTLLRAEVGDTQASIQSCMNICTALNLPKSASVNGERDPSYTTASRQRLIAPKRADVRFDTSVALSANRSRKFDEDNAQ